MTAAYLQYGLKGELGSMPFNLALGYRIEDTDVTSTSFIALPTAVRWDQNNDFSIPRGSVIEPYSETASYDNGLPSVDFDIDLTDTLKARASWGKTIARAGIGQLTAGATPGAPAGGHVIEPCASRRRQLQQPCAHPAGVDNIDLSRGVVLQRHGLHLGRLRGQKDVENFIGNSIVEQTLFGLTDPTAGPDALAAHAFLQGDGHTGKTTRRCSSRPRWSVSQR